MAGYGYDTEELVITVTLPDGKELAVVGSNDGVNGFSWSAATDSGATVLPVSVERTVLIDGITEVEQS